METQTGKRLTAQLNIRLDPEEVDALGRIVRLTGEKQSDVLRRLIRAEARRLAGQAEEERANAVVK